jgi:hypothetical protein
MVTIIPIDIDHGLIREGVQYAVAERLAVRLKAVQELTADLRAGSLVEREEWDREWAALIAMQEEMRPVLEYAKAFLDQWPEEGTDA